MVDSTSVSLQGSPIPFIFRLLAFKDSLFKGQRNNKTLEMGTEYNKEYRSSLLLYTSPDKLGHIRWASKLKEKELERN